MGLLVASPSKDAGSEDRRAGPRSAAGSLGYRRL